MPTAQIKFTQGTEGNPAEAFLGVTALTATVASAVTAGIQQFTFELLDAPPASTFLPAVVQDGATSFFEFVPDVVGGYLFKLIVKDQAGQQAVDVRCFGVLEPSGRFIPPLAAKASALNFGGQTRGWAAYLGEWLKYVDTLAPTADLAVIFDEGGSYLNLRSARGAFFQTPIDNTKSGIVCFGSTTGGVPPGVSGDFASLGGGLDNTIAGTYSTIAGGINNAIAATAGASMIGGGSNNSIMGGSAVIAGGADNTCSNAGGGLQTIGGGGTNDAFGVYSTIPGGFGARAPRVAQMSYSGGHFFLPGDAQSGLSYHVKGTSVGVAPLTLKDNQGFEFELEANHTYTVHAKCVAHRIDAGFVSKWESFVHDLLVRCDNAGIVTIISDSTAFMSSVSGGTFVLTGGGTILTATYTSGNAAYTMRVLCQFDWVELADAGFP